MSFAGVLFFPAGVRLYLGEQLLSLLILPSFSVPINERAMRVLKKEGGFLALLGLPPELGQQSYS